MANRTLLLGALIVAIIIVVASTVYVLSTGPSPSASLLILTPDDLGTDWNGTIHNSTASTLNQTGISSSSSADLFNETYGVYIIVDVYNSIIACQKEFDNYSDYVKTNPSQGEHTLLYENFTLGDRAFIGCWDSHEYPLHIVIIFIKDDIFCTVGYTMKPITNQPWWKNATISMAEMQAEKIDQQLAWI
jgi:hypothetical protein